MLRRLAPALVLLPALTAAAAADRAAGSRLFNGSGDTAGTISIGAAKLGSPLRQFPCRSCHGRDGTGGGEGGAPPVGWPELSVPTAARPAYDADGFGRVLRDGERPDGSRLASTMPRYELPQGVSADLLEYLDALPDEQRRGIAPDRVVFGVAVPPDNPLAAKRYADILENELSLLTRDRPVHGRRIVIRRLEGSFSDIEKAADDVAAVVGLVPSAQVEVEKLIEREIPVLFPLTLLSGDEDATLVRGMLPSLRQLSEELLESVAADGHKRVAVVETGAEPQLAPGTQPPGLSLVELDSSALPSMSDFDAVVMLGDDMDSAVRVMSRMWRDTPLYAIAGQLPALPGLAARRKARISLANGYARLSKSYPGRDIISSHAAHAARLLYFSLLQNRHKGLTRASLVEALDKPLPADLHLDYGVFSLTGTGEVEILTSEALQRH